MTENSEALKPKWYSIREAADYLDVGEPTIYRWMREGKITFRKVGDSTRFWKEDLDAVMQVFRSVTEAGQVKNKCPYCNHTDLVPGTVQSTGRTYFRPDETKFWTLRDSYIELSALMCTRCGGVAWFGDVKKLLELRKESSETGGREPEKS
ncbi:MAG: helix-turn-helix domain-containing protein [Verrucomicrobiota bacterium]|jgi:excisionase family DNA binding protein